MFFERNTNQFFTQSRIIHAQNGSFLWKQIDGEKTVGQLADALKAQFGKDAEPLYDRLVKYMQILRNNRFILFRGKDRMPK